MEEKELHKFIDRLLKLPKECEWAEFYLTGNPLEPQKIS